ncbi:MAG TPA: hypothetical protein VGS06_15310 [Streptosporangiaceae bacterium]|nr:hypothetical protein [Streptosporangiaceae bacterium]
MEQDRVDPLRPGGALAAQVVVQLQQRPAFQDVPGRDPALRQPALGQQHPLVPGVGLIAVSFPRRAALSAGSARCAAIPAAASSSTTYRHPAHPSTANATSSRPADRASQPRRCDRSAGRT